MQPFVLEQSIATTNALIAAHHRVGADAFLAKPFKRDDLIAAVREMRGRRRST